MRGEGWGGGHETCTWGQPSIDNGTFMVGGLLNVVPELKDPPPREDHHAVSRFHRTILPSQAAVLRHQRNETIIVKYLVDKIHKTRVTGQPHKLFTILTHM